MFPISDFSVVKWESELTVVTLIRPLYMQMMQNCSPIYIKCPEDSLALQKDLDNLTQWMDI